MEYCEFSFILFFNLVLFSWLSSCFYFAGLYDTVFDVDDDRDRAQAQDLEPNGFSFDGADVGGVEYALNRSVMCHTMSHHCCHTWPSMFIFYDVSKCKINTMDFFRAISAWYDGREWFNKLCKTVMEQDWSWNRPALDYLELYHAARKLEWGFNDQKAVKIRTRPRCTA